MAEVTTGHKFGLFGKVEDRARELLIGDNLPVPRVQQRLKEEGFDLTRSQLGTIKKNAFDDLVDEQRAEIMADFTLESVKKTTLKFEELYGKFERMLDSFEQKGESYNQLVVLRELKAMLNMSLKKLGEYKSGIEKISANNVNIITSTDVLTQIKANQDAWFDKMEPDVKDGKLIFNVPTPEVLDAYYRWRFKSGKTKSIQLLQ